MRSEKGSVPERKCSGQGSVSTRPVRAQRCGRKCAKDNSRSSRVSSSDSPFPAVRRVRRRRAKPNRIMESRILRSSAFIDPSLSFSISLCLLLSLPFGTYIYLQLPIDHVSSATLFHFVLLSFLSSPPLGPAAKTCVSHRVSLGRKRGDFLPM